MNLWSVVRLIAHPAHPPHLHKSDTRFGAHFSVDARKMIDDQKPMPYTGNMLKYSNKNSNNKKRLPQTVGSRGAPADLCADLTQTCEGLALKSWLMAINNSLQIDVETQDRFILKMISQMDNNTKISPDITHRNLYLKKK